VIVCDLVIAEVYYALQFHYDVPKGRGAPYADAIGASGVVTLEPREAEEILEATSGAGLVDRLIHARHRALGAVTITFERKLEPSKEVSAALELSVVIRSSVTASGAPSRSTKRSPYAVSSDIRIGEGLVADVDGDIASA